MQTWRSDEGHSNQADDCIPYRKRQHRLVRMHDLVDSTGCPLPGRGLASVSAARRRNTFTPRDCGEMEAYFYLRSLGYRIVAKNYRSARDHGEIDLIGWDEGVLCFVEVKTHSKLDWCLRRSRWMRRRRATSGRWRDGMCGNCRADRPPTLPLRRRERGSGRRRPRADDSACTRERSRGGSDDLAESGFYGQQRSKALVAT